jgi:hypothetical protein
MTHPSDNRILRRNSAIGAHIADMRLTGDLLNRSAGGEVVEEA